MPFLAEMQNVSSESVAILVPATFIVVGISFFAALTHLFIWFQQRKNWMYLFFSLVCIATASYSFASLYCATVDTIAEYASGYKGIIYFALFFSISFAWFSAFYTRTVAKPFLITITIILFILTAVNYFRPYSIVYTDITQLVPVTLPWGEQYVLGEASVSVAGIIVLNLAVNTVLVFALYACFKQFRRKEWLNASILALSIFIFIAGAAYDSLVELRLIKSVYIAQYPVVLFILIMSAELARQWREMTRELIHSENQYRRLVDSLERDYLIYSHDINGVFSFVSPSVKTVLGYSQEEFLTHYTAFFTDNPINTAAKQHTDGSLHGEKQPPYEIELFHKNGPKRLFEVTENPIFDDSKHIIAVEGIAHDITERKQIERKIQEQLDELSRWHEVTLNREDRVQELKREINILLERLGEPIRYSSQATDDDNILIQEAERRKEEI